ncbi:MAG TPA: serine/threonine-protein kinase [Gemmataceae bacterium]|jgi:serine/threonine protein kinase|nr:serine/threonine-protein kinase [Gemmataceae bacterium]
MAEAAEAFLKSVLRSGLLDKTQLQDALRSFPKDRADKAQELAKHLIQAGKISRFQAHKLLAGITLGLRLGPYLIQTPIGRGGMGAVYLASDIRNGQHLAIKVLPPKRARAEERYLARFQREMELSQKVSHPHIALTHEAGMSQGVYFIAMEYIPGQSLYRLVVTQGPLSVPRAAHLFAEVASALEHAHNLGLIHRDLKPSNIMVTPNDHAKVLDLGLAIMEGEVSENVEVIGGRGYVLGSIDYMAPEQTLDSTQVDGRSDLYAVGCVLFFALTGKPPFPEGSAKDKVSAHRRREPDAVQLANRGIPEAFAKLVLRLLEKKPEDRYPNAAALRAELLAWCPREADRPVEREGDQTQQAAARALEIAPLTPEVLKTDPLPVAESIPSAEPTLPTDFFAAKENNKVMRMALGTVAFWVLLVLLVLAVLLLR